MVTTPLPPSIIAAFTTLTLALASLWAPRISAAPRAARAWIVPGVLALILAFIGGLIDVRGLIVVLSFAAACIAANRVSGPLPSIVTHAIMLAIGVSTPSTSCSSPIQRSRIRQSHGKHSRASESERAACGRQSTGASSGSQAAERNEGAECACQDSHCRPAAD